MNQIKNRPAECFYDSACDVLAFRVKREFEHSETVELYDRLRLGLDGNGEPAALEISEASKRFNVSGECLKKLKDFKMTITVTGRIITLNAKIGVGVDEGEGEQSIEGIAFNRQDIPKMKIVFT